MGKVNHISDLFNMSRIQRPFTWKHVLLLMYAPIGIILSFIRATHFFLIGIPFYTFVRVFLPSWEDIYLDYYALIYGIRRRWKNKDILDKKPNPSIIVSNHITDYDYFGLLATHFAVVLSPYWKNMEKWTKKIGLKMIFIYVRSKASGSTDETNREDVRSNILQTLKNSKVPLYILPEGGTTNGNAVMLFQKFIFSIGEEIQPIAIRLQFPIWLPINIDHLRDNFLTNLLTLTFIPMTIYEYTVLPRQMIKPGESAEDFAWRVQNIIANELDVPAVRFTYKDKNNLRHDWDPII